MLRKHLIFLALLLPILLLAFIPTNRVEASDPVIVVGRVVETSTGQPIENATVLLWERSELVARVRTDSEGYYETEGERGSYTIYAYYDDPITPGFDFVPTKQSLYLQGQGVNTTFTLIPGASITVTGDIRIVDVSPSSSLVGFLFEVKDPLSETTLCIDEYAFVYGGSFGYNPQTSHNYFLNLNNRHVIVPADTIINIEGTATFRYQTSRGRWPSYSQFNRTFTIDEVGHFTLSQGQMLSLDVNRYTLTQDLSIVQYEMSSIEERLNEMEQKGFYTVNERGEFSRITGLMEDGSLGLDQGFYDESFADMREAYVSALNLNERLLGMYRDSGTSVVIIIFLLALTATATGHLLFEDRSRKLMATCVIYLTIVLVLYAVYPGCQLLHLITFLVTAIGSLGVVLSVPQFLLLFIKERPVKRGIALRSAVGDFLSMAKRNLKRRRLRSALTFITVTVLVMSFVALTSIQVGYGLVFKPQLLVTPTSDGLLVRQQPYDPTSTDSPFNPFNVSDVEWLLGKPDTSSVAPKAENYPSLDPIGKLGSLQLFGWLGILPSVEAQITRINETIVEGRYPQDSEENAVMISTDTMKKMNLEIGDQVWLQTASYSTYVELVGAFDGKHLAQIKDLDGKRILPQKLVSNDEIGIAYCDPSEMVITHWQTALRFNMVHISRLGVVPSNSEAAPVLARQLALERELLVWISTGGRVSLTYIGSTFELKGLTLLVPWGIVILNVVVTMLNAFHIRRKEISTLSAVGLNPSHISWLFLTEAGIVGVIGGGIGYLLGLGLYPLMSFFSAGVEVYQKVSAVWCIGAIAIAVAAVLIGGVTALKNSTVVTPSLIRRWTLEKEKHPVAEPWTINLPVRILPGDIDSFMSYLESSLKTYQKFPQGPHFEQVVRFDEGTTQAEIKKIKFIYVGDFATSNEIVGIRESGADIYLIRLISRGQRRGIEETGRLIRGIAMHWSVDRSESTPI